MKTKHTITYGIRYFTCYNGHITEQHVKGFSSIENARESIGRYAYHNPQLTVEYIAVYPHDALYNMLS